MKARSELPEGPIVELRACAAASGHAAGPILVSSTTGLADDDDAIWTRRAGVMIASMARPPALAAEQ
jgi:hypothetical protein